MKRGFAHESVGTDKAERVLPVPAVVPPPVTPVVRQPATRTSDPASERQSVAIRALVMVEAPYGFAPCCRGPRRTQIFCSECEVQFQVVSKTVGHAHWALLLRRTWPATVF